MLEKIMMKGDQVYGFEAVGKVTSEDYQNVLHPLLNQIRGDGKKARCLLLFGPRFEGFTPSAAWEDVKLGFDHIQTFQKIAIVTDHAWVKGAVRLVSSMMPFSVSIFDHAMLDEAKQWIAADTSDLNYQLDKVHGVLNVQIEGPLTADRFGVLTEQVDSWIEKNGKLNGLVIQTKTFPGWKNLGSLIGHIVFVHNHHTSIKKVALCGDGVLLELGPALAKHFVHAQVQHFTYQQVEQAKQWAAS
ncbi:MAG: STAS/SEC14 domain-containing protein [Bdellovibrionota bacterium]